MNYNTPTDTDAAQTEDPLDLPVGTAVEITYKGVRGSRTIRTHLVEFDQDYFSDGEYFRTEVTFLDSEARRTRYVRFSYDSEDGFDPSDFWTPLKSLNSKSPRGRRLGTIEAVEIVHDDVSETAASMGELRATEVGDVVSIRDDGMTLTGIAVDRYGSRVWVEFEDGTQTIYSTFPGLGAHYYDREDRESVEVGFKRTGQTVDAPEDARELFERIASYGHDTDRGKVTTVEYQNTTYEVDFRHDAEGEGIQLSGPNSIRDGDVKLRLDPLGITLDGERISPDDLDLVFENDVEDSEDSEDVCEPATDGGVDVEDSPEFTPEEIREMIAGAELLRYSEGTGEDAGTVMAVFLTPQGRGIGLTMSDDSTTPEHLIGERLREFGAYVEDPVQGRRAHLHFETPHVVSVITITNTRSLGVYEVDVEPSEDVPLSNVGAFSPAVTDTSPHPVMPNRDDVLLFNRNGAVGDEGTLPVYQAIGVTDDVVFLNDLTGAGGVSEFAPSEWEQLHAVTGGTVASVDDAKRILPRIVVRKTPDSVAVGIVKWFGSVIDLEMFVFDRFSEGGDDHDGPDTVTPDAESDCPDKIPQEVADALTEHGLQIPTYYNHRIVSGGEDR